MAAWIFIISTVLAVVHAMIKARVFVCLVSLQSTTPAGKQCLSDADCSDLECCHKQHEYLVVSRRDEPFPTENLENKIGVCEPYKLEGEACSILGKENGYCECNENQGYTCQPTGEDSEMLIGGFGPHTCARVILDSKK